MMKKKVRTGAVITAVAAALLAMGHVIGADPGADAETQVPLSVTREPYIVGTYDGKIALFSDGIDETPAVFTDIEVGTLREYDKKLLESGIKTESYEDVLRLLEDFGS